MKKIFVKNNREGLEFLFNLIKIFNEKSWLEIW